MVVAPRTAAKPSSSKSGTRAFLRGARRVARAECLRKRMTQWPTITTAIPGSAPESRVRVCRRALRQCPGERQTPRHSRVVGALISMERIRTIEAAAHEGRRVRVEGWLHAVGRLGGVSFVVVRDGWGLAQVVATSEDELAPLAATGAGVESIVAVEGTVASAPQAPGGVELRAPRIEVLVPVTEPPPIALNKREIKTSLTPLLRHAPTANRHPQRRAILRLGARAIAGCRKTPGARGFTEIATPKSKAAATQSTAKQ